MPKVTQDADPGLPDTKAISAKPPWTRLPGAHFGGLSPREDLFTVRPLPRIARMKGLPTSSMVLLWRYGAAGARQWGRYNPGDEEACRECLPNKGSPLETGELGKPSIYPMLCRRRNLGPGQGRDLPEVTQPGRASRSGVSRARGPSLP